MDYVHGNRRGFNTDGQVQDYKPYHVNVIDKIRVRDWTNELTTDYVKPRLMSEQMQNYTSYFFQGFQRQREALWNEKKPKVDSFRPYQKVMETKNKNLVASYIRDPLTYAQQQHKYCPLASPLRTPTHVMNYLPRYNRRRDITYFF